jgi:hypothetical protein
VGLVALGGRQGVFALVLHRVYEVAGHTILTVRPSRTAFVEKKIADFHLVLTSGPEIKRDVEYKIHARLETSEKPTIDPERVRRQVP